MVNPGIAATLGIMLSLLSGACAVEPEKTAVAADVPRVPEPVFGGEMFIEQHGVGNAQSVVFVHGIGDNAARDWDNIVPAVAARFHTIAFDWPGFGRSTKAEAEYSPHNYARVLKWIVDQYAHGPVVIVGHSMGANIALYFAAQHPESVRRLILFDAAGVLHRTTLLKYLAVGAAPQESNNRITARLFGWFQRLIEKGERLAQRHADSVDESQLRKMVIEDTPATIAGAAMMETDFSPLIAKVTAPTTLVWGERDRVAPLRTGLVLADWLPQTVLVTIPEAAHVPMNETPERAREIVEAALIATSLPPRAGTAEPDFSKAANLRCENQNDETYTGVWSTIDITRCSNIELRDVVAREIVIKESKVSLLNVRVLGGETGISVERSEFNATNLRVNAEVALRTSGSRHDLAGIELVGTRYAIANNLPGYVLCSLCTLRSDSNVQTWHGVYELELSASR